MPNATITDLSSLARIENVRLLDPLNADPACFRLRAMNAQADVPAIAGALRALIPGLDEVATYSVDECLAAMRDLGMFLGSLKRHGVEPLSVVPEATAVLEELGRRTDMVPRDTVHHYTTWNPLGHRQRMYTGDPQEGFLQESVRMVFPSLRTGLNTCDVLADTAPTDPEFAPLLDELNLRLTAMVDSIDLVLRHVSPVFFARVLRPYFEEIIVSGRELLGPAAAQVPLWLVDQVIWAADRSEPDYSEFIRHSVPFSLPRWRSYYTRWTERRSVVSRLVDAFGGVDGAATGNDSLVLRRGAEALARVLRTVVVFRGRHLGIARQAYQADLRLYPVGSGGASVELLRQIIDLTRQNAGLVQARRSDPPTESHRVRPEGTIPRQRWQGGVAL
ncbi:monodechloroaminopyrrolnitrin synthase PrnB family protein [Micromonospora sp. NPDC049171]|uniref:monodechloroaminopyrrolnitrin synthase PrnB family protein n=1 Tax=Micromonospora sp. NPDC049171 TaxID=3155770 RepID=UPI0033DCF9A0